MFCRLEDMDSFYVCEALWNELGTHALFDSNAGFLTGFSSCIEFHGA